MVWRLRHIEVCNIGPWQPGSLPQPGFDWWVLWKSHVSTWWAHSMHMLVILEMNWCLGPRTLAERNVTLRRSSAIPKPSRKLNGMRNAQPEISHEAAELILRNQAARIDEKFPGTVHVSHQLALVHGHENVFYLHTVWCRKRWWSSESTEVSVRRIWRIPPEFKTQA